MKRLYSTIICFLFSMVALLAQNLQGTTIYVNPGHGGFDSDDRNMPIAPFAMGDHNGFWESQSNLDKGLQLVDMLKKAGATVYISRTTNTTDDDLDLSTIVEMANEVDADYMLSIHSNAGITNYILQLYAGVDAGDTETYPTPTPCSDESRAISTIIANNLYTNQINTWAAAPTVRGDKTFARTAMKWSDGYGVLRGLSVPGCISEGSMHDYIPETYRLMNMDYKWLEAWHFFKSFSTYFNGGEITTGNIAGTVHDSRNKNLANYLKISGSKDELLPLCKAKITLTPGDSVYTTDNLYNGIYIFKNLAPGTYQAKIEAEGYISHTETLVVKANETTYFNAMLDMIRNTPPEVTSYSPNVALTDSVICSTPIIFEFNWDVDVESASKAFSISPNVEGTISFEDSQHRMIFKPNKPYEKSTLYTVKLDKSLKHPGDISMVQDFSFQFITKNRNRLNIFAYYPKANDEGVYYVKPNFEFHFDKTLNPLTIRDAIKVYDSKGIELAKNARSVKTNKLVAPYGSNSFILVNDLIPGEEYKVRLDRNVVDVDGIDIVDPIEYTFKATDVKVTNKTVAEEFETASLLAYDAGSSSDVASASVTRSTSQKMFGTSSYNFQYAFNSSSNGTAVYKVSTPVLTVNSSKGMGAHIYGDLTGNNVYLQFAAGDDIQYVKLSTLDFLGWEYAETSLNSLPAGKDYIFTGIKLEQKNQPVTSSGSFYIDNLLLYDGLINSILPKEISGLRMYPNPVSDILHVSSTNEDICSLELYSLNGVMVKKVNSSNMNVSTLSEGTYILKMFLGNKVFSKLVIISR